MLHQTLRPGETGQHCFSNISIWSLVTFVCQFRHSQIYMAKLAGMHRTSNICLPTCKMCLPNMKCLKNFVVAKRASKDRLLELSHVRQTMLVRFARPLLYFSLNEAKVSLSESHCVFLNLIFVTSPEGPLTQHNNIYNWSRDAIYSIYIYKENKHDFT